MKQRTEKISTRLRNYGKNSTKKSKDCQVELEIRNYTDNPIRINAKFKDNSLMQLRPHQIKKGLCIGRSDANIINARLNKHQESFTVEEDQQHFLFNCIGGHFTDPKLQKTQQSPF